MNGPGKIRKILTAALTAPPLLYVAGILAQFIVNIRAWKAAGSDLHVSPGLPALQPGACLRALVKFPEGLIAAAAVFGAAAVLILMRTHPAFGTGGRTGGGRSLTLSASGSYGTSAFMSAQEAKRCFDITQESRTDRDILGMMKDGRVVTLPKGTRLNSNLAVCGTTGAGKSRSISRNLILQAARRGDSVVVTDPKGELYDSMSGYLRARGYIVRVFNLVQMEHGDAWNCLREIGSDELMAQVFSEVVMRNTGGPGKDPFWYSAETNLLNALLLYTALEMPPEKRTLAQVYDLLCGAGERDLSGEIARVSRPHRDPYTGELRPPCPAGAPYSIFMQSSEAVRSNVITGLGSKLQVMQSKQVRDITSHDEIDLELPGKQKCAYFCIVSDQDSTFSFLSSLFFNFLFIRLIRYADGCCPDGVLPVKVRFILDEFTNCCVIPDFTKKCSTIRSRGCSVAVFFQNVSQVKNRYPDDQWQEILGACDTTLFLGSNDVLTNKYFSERVGEATVEIEGTARELYTARLTDYTPQYRSTVSVGRRMLMTPEEIGRLDPQEELIFVRGQKVLKALRYDYSRHSEYPKLTSARAAAHEPEWRKARDAAAAAPQTEQIPAAEAAPEKESGPDTARGSAGRGRERVLGRKRDLNDIL